MTPSRNIKILAVLLVTFVFCDILLSPLGFETRGSAILTNPASLPWLGLLFGGLTLNIVSLILVFFRARIASIFAIIGSIGYIILGFADQLNLVTSLPPPQLITDVEVITIVVLVATILFASRVYRENSPHSDVGKNQET
ncbi:MAG: hypothetical protein OK422_02150 [Thaumarchaeota archaeon]|nr:hypothetical protein [Nitrososphaerota archaeon]